MNVQTLWLLPEPEPLLAYLLLFKNLQYVFSFYLLCSRALYRYNLKVVTISTTND